MKDLIKKYGRYLYIVQACIAGAAIAVLIFSSLPPRCYTKDLHLDYLTARALRDGVDILTPMNELSARYFPALIFGSTHPSPHPPFLSLVFLPLTWVPFPVLVMLWLALNIALVLVVGRFIGFSVQGTLPLLAWPPLWALLYIGNFELMILVFAVLGWRAAAARRDVRAGVWLGIAAAIKLYPILLLVPYVTRRRVRLLMTAGLVFLLSQLASLVTVGMSGMFYYYGEVLPAVSKWYQVLAVNNSPHGALLRWFGGATDVGPLLHTPGVVVPVTIVFSLFALLALARLEPEASPVAILVALPATWYTYVTLALPQIVILLRSPSRRHAAFLAAAASSFTLPLVNLLIGPLSQLMRLDGSGQNLLAVLLTTIQPIGLIALLVLSVIQSFEHLPNLTDNL